MSESNFKVGDLVAVKEGHETTYTNFRRWADDGRPVLKVVWVDGGVVRVDRWPDVYYDFRFKPIGPKPKLVTKFTKWVQENEKFA